MKEYRTDNIINLALVGHASSGKTSLAEAFSVCAKSVHRQGNVQNGSTLSDYRKQEINNQHSISMSLLNFEFMEKKFNIIDTPGYTDFIGEMKAGLSISEVACIVINSSEGIEVGSELGWEYATQNKQAKIEKSYVILILKGTSGNLRGFSAPLASPFLLVRASGQGQESKHQPTEKRFGLVHITS